MEIKYTEGLVFFTDISGFARLAREMELSELVEFMLKFAEITRRHVESAGGTVVKYIGDSALGYFNSNKVDEGVSALLTMQREIEEDFIVKGKKTGLRIGAHYGEFARCTLLPVEEPDLIGETINIAAMIGSGGQTKHRSKLIISPEAFRKLGAESRKQFHKFTEPIVYLAEA
ncbi:MAG: adenylate/guanylate cyclase domain-containing protein [Spirochaetales bacterium]|nr:adenylate/guanylate cyclase domain-containing protein [Spirochaetales bacterium]